MKGAEFAKLVGDPRRFTGEHLIALAEVHEMLTELPAACVAVVVKQGISILAEQHLVSEDVVTLAELDKITDSDPEL
jgi:hypothetical protein